MVKKLIAIKDNLFRKTKVYKELNIRNRINWEWILLINNFCQIPTAKSTKPNHVAQFKDAARIKTALKYALEGKSVTEALEQQKKPKADIAKANTELRNQHAVTH